MIKCYTLNRTQVINQSIDNVFKEMGKASKIVKYPGLAIILDKGF